MTYTPTTDEVRTWSEAGYVALHAADAVKIPPAERSRWLDRWLAGIRAEAWDEGFGVGATHGIAYQAGDDNALPQPPTLNPYRKDRA